MQRITIPEILEDEWFKKGYKPPIFEEKDDTDLDDVDAVFKDSEVSMLRSPKSPLKFIVLRFVGLWNFTTSLNRFNLIVKCSISVHMAPMDDIRTIRSAESHGGRQVPPKVVPV